MLTLGGILRHDDWAMSPGERAALEGILAALRPRLSLEIGTWKGGSLDRISANSTVVHAFDLARDASVTSERFPNVTFHIGSSHEVLPRVLHELAVAGHKVDFAFVDGDHTVEGVRRDIEDLLASPALRSSVLLLHDTLNERVREGLERVNFDGYADVSYVDFDFVPGRVMCEGPQRDEYWSGLGLVVTGHPAGAADWARAYPTPDVYRAFSDARARRYPAASRLGHEQLLQLDRQLSQQKEIRYRMERSLSWRMTAPVRRLRQLIGSRL